MSVRLCVGLLNGLVALSEGWEVRVDTSFGPLIGEHEFFSGCDRWLGVPFADAPVGALRFESPRPWQQAFPPEGRWAVSPGSKCTQPPAAGESAPGGTEDCLYLNIWRPHGSASMDNLAVMFWVHGGAFVEGSGVERVLPVLPNIYDGCKLASEQGVVFVSINYRLGPFGFGTFQGADGEVRSNFGMLDQREALRWVRREVSSFGGDPEKITMFGESAGGISTMHHAVTPQSQGLFRAGISESGFPMAVPLVEAVLTTARMVDSLGCAGVQAQLECLRGKTAEEVMDAAIDTAVNGTAGQATQWMPVIDGVELPEHPLALWKQGKSHVAAMMAGTNTDEGNSFIYGPNSTAMSTTGFETFLEGQFCHGPLQLTPDELQQVRDTYPAMGPDVRPVASQVFTDFTFLCGTHFAMRAQSRLTDAFAYRFNWRSACKVPGDFGNIPGVFHGSEMQYVFGDGLRFGCLWEKESWELSTRMMRGWGDFAKFLDPSHSNPGSYPKYNSESQVNVILAGSGDGLEENYREDFCQLWEDIAYSKLISLGANRSPAMSEIVV